jgi:ATP-dependent helicase/nuclease subunit B
MAADRLAVNHSGMANRPCLGLVTGILADLEVAFLTRIATIRNAHPLSPITVVIGGVLQRPYLQRLIADSSPGLLNIRFSTAGELGISLGEQAMVEAGRRALPAMAARGYAAEIARQTEGYFGPVAHTPGFAEATRQLVGELRQEDIPLEELERLGPSIAESPAKAAGLADVYRRYLHGRADRYDGADALAVADPSVFDGVELLVYGVWRFGWHGRRLLKELAERVSVTVFLPTAGGEPGVAHLELRDWLVSIGASVEIAVPSEARATALNRLHATLFRPSNAVEPDNTVQLVSAPDPLSEVREAARTCLDWARDGILFREMAITYRDAPTYRPVVEAVFTEAGIPVYLDDGPSIAERPIGRRILALIDLIDSKLRRRDVLAFLTDGWLPKETRERYGDVAVSRWESASRRAGIAEGLDQWRARLTSLIAREREDAAREDAPEWLAARVTEAESLLRFIEDFATILAAHPAQGTWAECLASFRRLVEDVVQDPEQVLGHLDQLAQLDELTGPVDYARFLDTVRAEIQALKAGDLEGGNQGALGLRGVSVLDVNALRHLRFRAVAVLGLTERSFPPPPRQDPLLLDDEREALNKAGGFTLPLRSRGPDQEPLQFAVAVSAARERLLLSTRRAAEAGARAQLPSSFFREAASALAGRRLDASKIGTLGAGFYRFLRAGRIGSDDPKRALTEQERDTSLLESNQALGTALLHALAPASMRADAHRRARWATTALTPFDGVLEHSEAIAELGAWFERTAPLSPSTIETYANCPYRFFLQRLLKVKPLEEPETIIELDALTRGKAIHEVLETFLAGHAPEELGNVDRATLQASLRAIADRVLAEVEAAGLAGATITWKRARTEIVDDLARWLDSEIAHPGSYPERAFEVAFGGKWSGRDESALSTDEPLELDVGGRIVPLRGRIDRLEWEPGGTFRIIDYKSGKNRLTGVFEGGRTLQLALYLLAAAKLVKIDVAQGSASYEFTTRRGGFASHTLAGSELASLQGDLDGVLGRIVGGIFGGDFHPEPSENTCRMCDFTSVCDVRRIQISKRKATDERRESFTVMKEIP